MPEGDTIFRHAARLRPLLVGQALEEVRHRGAALHDLRGERVASIDTHGKHLWLRLSDGSALHVHLGMEGGWTLLSAAGLAKTPWRVARASLALVVARGAALCDDAPTAEWLRGPDARRGLAALGPDVLAEPLDLDGVLARVAEQPHARPLGEVLLDQRVVAGIGNVWKSELCFMERLDPRQPIGEVDTGRLRALLVRAGRMMRANAGAGGWPRTTTAARPGAGAPPAAEVGRYWVYRKDARPCPRCGARIERIVQGADGGRSTYLCPRCVGGAEEKGTRSGAEPGASAGRGSGGDASAGRGDEEHGKAAGAVDSSRRARPWKRW